MQSTLLRSPGTAAGSGFVPGVEEVGECAGNKVYEEHLDGDAACSHRHGDSHKKENCTQHIKQLVVAFDLPGQRFTCSRDPNRTGSALFVG